MNATAILGAVTISAAILISVTANTKQTVNNADRPIANTVDTISHVQKVVVKTSVPPVHVKLQNLK